MRLDGCKFGRVVKAVALGAILVRGRGSNPLACIFFVLILLYYYKKKKKIASCGNRTHAIRDDYDLNVAP